jgi:2'-5' RNA ligase
VPSLAVTLAVEPDAQHRLDDELARWSGGPAAARITLFRELPDELEEQARVDLVDIGGAPFPVGVAGVLPFPNGVAFGLASPELVARRQELATLWWPQLGERDRRGFRPHVVVLRDASGAEARAAYQVLRREFRPYQLRAEGFVLWRTEGPWTELARIPFA